MRRWTGLHIVGICGFAAAGVAHAADPARGALSLAPAGGDVSLPE